MLQFKMSHGPAISAFAMVAMVCHGALAGPPLPTLTDTDPGIQLLFSGDPNTTEDGCAHDAPRATIGGEGGKMHNELLECDNWDFSTTQWGQTSFLQGAFILGNSPFDGGAGWECSGNVYTPGAGYVGSPCGNSTVRVTASYKNTPPPKRDQGHAMSEAKDWVLRFDFKVDTIPGDTFGGDKLFEPQGMAAGDILTITGASDNLAGPGFPREASSYFNGESNRYKVRYGPAPDGSNGSSSEFIIPGQLNQGTFTLHYKAANQRLDLWLDDTKLLANFESYSGVYDLDRLQLGGGGGSFENAIYDNIILGVFVDGGECGPAGSGTGVPGDFNCDGMVDVADLGIVGANFNGTEVTYVDGDANLDGAVDVADLGVVGANWSSAQGTSLSQALHNAGLNNLVPESTTIATVIVFGAMCLVRRGGCRHGVQ